ncbi:MAG: hypothetical protein WBM90_02315 [Acidimicrobiia bacterium]
MFELVGTFVPVIGMIATVVVAALTSGRVRWIALLTIPAATVALCLLIAEEVGRDGNLLFVAFLALLYVVVIVYYPVLAVVGLFKWLKSRS